MEVISTPNAPIAIGPYSQAVIVNGCIYTSGCIPIDPKTNELFTGDIKAQSKLCLENLRELLKAGHADMTDVFSTHVYLKDMAQFGEFNSIYEQFFKPPYPARVCIQAAKLPKDAGIEIEAIAKIPTKPKI